jgi:hypothetical protein
VLLTRLRPLAITYALDGLSAVCQAFRDLLVQDPYLVLLSLKLSIRLLLAITTQGGQLDSCGAGEIAYAWRQCKLRGQPILSLRQARQDGCMIEVTNPSKHLAWLGRQAATYVCRFWWRPMLIVTHVRRPCNLQREGPRGKPRVPMRKVKVGSAVLAVVGPSRVPEPGELSSRTFCQGRLGNRALI